MKNRLTGNLWLPLIEPKSFSDGRQVGGKKSTARNRVRFLWSGSWINEQTYRCALWLCHKRVISAEDKMTGQLRGCLASWALLLSPSLASTLGSEILTALYILTSLLLLLSIWFNLLVPVLSKSALPCSMSHTPTKYLIGSTECWGFYAYPTSWLLSSGICSNWPRLWIYQLPQELVLPPIIVLVCNFLHNHAMDLSEVCITFPF